METHARVVELRVSEHHTDGNTGLLGNINSNSKAPGLQSLAVPGSDAKAHSLLLRACHKVAELNASVAARPKPMVRNQLLFVPKPMVFDGVNRTCTSGYASGFAHRPPSSACGRRTRH